MLGQSDMPGDRRACDVCSRPVNRSSGGAGRRDRKRTFDRDAETSRILRSESGID